MKKNIIFNTIGTTIMLASQWLISVFVIRLGGLDAGGSLTLAISICNIFFVLGSCNIRQFQVSDIKGEYSDTTYYTLRTLLSTTVLLLCVVYMAISNYTSHQKIIVCVYMLYKTVSLFADICSGKAQCLWRMDIIGIGYALKGISSLVLFCIGMVAWQSLVVAILMMFCGDFIIFVLWDYRQLKKIAKIQLSFQWRCMSSLLLKCTPLVTSSVLFSYLAIYPRLVLEKYHGSEMLGVYSALAAPATIVQVMANFILVPLITVFAEYYNQQKTDQIWKLMGKITLGILLGGGILMFGSYVLGAWGLTLLFGAEVAQYSHLLPLTLLAGVIMAITMLVMQLNTVVRDSTGLLMGTVAGILVTVAFANYTVERYAIDGLNYVVILAMVIQTIILIITVRQKIKKDGRQHV